MVKRGACWPVPPVRVSVKPFIERLMITASHIPASITPTAMPVSASVEDPPPMQSKKKSSRMPTSPARSGALAEPRPW